jgi:hypothetical protein
MPRVEAHPASVSSTLEIFPKGTYELTIQGVAGFIGKQENAAGEMPSGVRYTLVIDKPTQFKGKRVLQNCYQHNEGSQSMAKQFLMAALGYGRSRPEEERFNEDEANTDWGYDTDGPVGDGWNKLVGRTVVGDFDVQMNKQRPGEDQQKISWRPLGK